MVNQYDKLLLSNGSQQDVSEFTELHLHSAAESTRERCGYSSGYMGNDFIPLDPSKYMYCDQLKVLGNREEKKHITKKQLKSNLAHYKRYCLSMYRILYKTIHFYQAKVDDLQQQNTLLKKELIGFYKTWNFFGRNGEYVILKAKDVEEINQRIAQLEKQLERTKK